MLSLMSQEEMTAALEELLPTEAMMLRGVHREPLLDRGILAMLLLLAKQSEEQEERIKDLEKYKPARAIGW